MHWTDCPWKAVAPVVLAVVMLLCPFARAEEVSAAGSQGTGNRGMVIPGGTAGPFEELLLETRVNHLPPPLTVLALRDPRGGLWLPNNSFSNWNMHPPPGPRLHYEGRDYLRLDGHGGLGYRIDMSRLVLDIDATARWFLENQVDSDILTTVLAPEVDPGGFLNYDVNVTHDRAETHSAALLEAGGFGKWGVAMSTVLARDAQPYQGEGVVRLETTWVRDIPERRASLRAGDSIGSGSEWGRPVRFGGIQWATNFATQPGFVTFPLPAMLGEAALPSTLELYVNGIRRLQSEVPSGPFSIPDLPTVSGYGEVQLIVRDLLGREQLITDTFYVGRQLLREGLHEFSYEIGAERENFGRKSNDYGRTFAVGTHRYGINNRLTGEARLELLSGQYTAGLGGALLIGRIGVLHGALAGSHGGNGPGAQLTVGFEHSSRHFGFGLNLQLAGSDFVQLGLDRNSAPPRRLGRVSISIPFQRAGSASLSYVFREERVRAPFESVTASYQTSVGRFGYLSAFATQLRGEEEDTLIGLSFTRLLGSRASSSASFNSSRHSDQFLLQMQSNLPPGPGFAYRVLAGTLDQDRLDAGISAQNGVGTWHLDASHANGETGIRAEAIGGIAWLDHSWHASRHMDQSFAVVHVGEFEGVRVYADNQHVATTDRQGRALVPRLRAYEENPLSIAVDDLPLGARIDQVEEKAVPYFRSGLVVDFEVSRSRNAEFRLVRADGEPVPAGSVISTPDGERFPVGFEGQTFVTGVASGTTLTASWNGVSCDFQLILPEGDEPLPDLGTITCEEAER